MQQSTIYSRQALRRILESSNVLEIHRKTGIAYQTLLSIRRGGDVYVSTAEKLTVYFRELAGEQ